LLAKKVVDNVAHFDSNELLSYQKYLSPILAQEARK
jgi:hypothetical protein